MKFNLLRKSVIFFTLVLSLCIFAFATDTAKISASGGLNFREGASASAKIICSIPNGTSITVLERGAEWSKISYNNTQGYVSSKYLAFTVKTAVVSVSAANVRSSYSETSSRVATLSHGTSVTVLSTVNNWCQIKKGNITGYIRSDLLSDAIPATVESANTTKKRTDLINYAATLLGTPYKSGGASASGFDCSGYTQYVFKKFGYTLPRGPASQMNALGTKISKSELKPGDLVFFKNPSSGRSIGHVGIYVGNGQMIHSNKPGGSVRYVTINSGYYATNYVGARRVIFD